MADDLRAKLDEGLAAARAGDYAAAWSIWRALARGAHDNAEAQFRLAWLYENGRGVKKDHAEAAKWYSFAAVQGHVHAQYNLGLMYVEGRGVWRNEARAAAWFRRAAVQGHGKAQYNLGLLYATGRGVPKDSDKAAYWLDRAKASGIVQPIPRVQV